jgi:predicted ArsR family transcriptional regulator
MTLPLLERRRIEAGVLVPLIRAFQAEFGEERVNELVGKTIREIARAQGAANAPEGGATIASVAERLSSGVLAEGSLIVDVVERDDAHFGFNVTRCKFVEMYEEMGARDLGFLLSCNRDFASFEGMAPELDFDRTQTRMEGASHCDFRYATKAQPIAPS